MATGSSRNSPFNVPTLRVKLLPSSVCSEHHQHERNDFVQSRRSSFNFWNKDSLAICFVLFELSWEFNLISSLQRRTAWFVTASFLIQIFFDSVTSRTARESSRFRCAYHESHLEARFIDWWLFEIQTARRSRTNDGLDTDEPRFFEIAHDVFSCCTMSTGRSNETSPSRQIEFRRSW